MEMSRRHDRPEPEVSRLCRLFDELDVQAVIVVRVSAGLKYLCCLFSEFGLASRSPTLLIS